MPPINGTDLFDILFWSLGPSFKLIELESLIKKGYKIIDNRAAMEKYSASLYSMFIFFMNENLLLL